jgi:hypothetical protein
MTVRLLPALLAVLLLLAPAVEARTVHRCVRDGSVSLSTAPEPGSRCTAVEIEDSAAKVPNLWGAIGVHQGKLYRREQDGRTVYGTRALPGSTEVLAFTVKTPLPPRLDPVPGALGAPRLDAFAAQFRATARATGVDEAWLRSIAHAESGFDRLAESSKGAQGVMQLMPATAALYGVSDPFASAQSIDAGARYLKDLIERYDGELTLVAAAYNAGSGAITRYGGVPPYPETRAYVAKVMALHALYQAAMKSPAVASAP